MQARNSSNLKGIDISHSNGNVDFKQLAQQNIKVVMIKATEGNTFTDPMHVTYANSAKSNGIHFGFYHLLHIYKASTVQQQVNAFIAAIKGIKTDCLLVADVEEITYHDNCNAAAVTAQTLEFADKVKAATGVEVILYANTDFIKNYFTKDICRLKFWIADYRNSTAPGENGKSENWAGFQYSEHGAVSGVTGDCDLDAFTNDILIPVPKPAPKPTPSKTLKVGAKVKVNKTATVYATGQHIPDWVKGQTYTVQQIKSDRVLLKEIISWVFIKDITY